MLSILPRLFHEEGMMSTASRYCGMAGGACGGGYASLRPGLDGWDPGAFRPPRRWQTGAVLGTVAQAPALSDKRRAAAQAGRGWPLPDRELRWIGLTVRRFTAMRGCACPHNTRVGNRFPSPTPTALGPPPLPRAGEDKMATPILRWSRWKQKTAAALRLRRR